MAVGGLGIGAGIANAADPLTATQLSVSGKEDGHTYNVYKLGNYAGATEGNVSVTATDGGNAAITAAVTAANASTDPLTSEATAAFNAASDKVAWAASLSTGAAGSYNADLRKIAQYLTKNTLTTAGVAIDQTATDAIAAATDNPAVVDVQSAGWYIITNDYTATSGSAATGVSTIIGTYVKDVPGATGEAKLKPTNGNTPGDNTPDDFKKTLTGAVVKGANDTFTITSKLPNATEWDTTKTDLYKVVDHPSKILGEFTDLKVTIDGTTELDKDTDYTVSTGSPIDSDHNPDYIVDLTPYFQAHAADITGGQKLAITYKATVASDPTADQAKAVNSFDVIKNGVKVGVPPNDPNPGNPGTDTPVDSTVELTINKVDENDKPLDGAVFTLEDADGNKIVDVTTGAGNTPGEAKVTNLGAGTYKFVETHAPSDYALYDNLGAQAVVTATKDDTKAITMSTVVTALDGSVGVGLGLSSVTNNVATVRNVKNISQLPLTGAAGVFLFLIVAALLAGGAGTMVMISKRNKKAGMAL
jgi:uncharacterized surface anchored protein